MMMFRPLHDQDGTVWAISLLDPAAGFDQEIVVSHDALACADYKFWRHGDGLIVVNAIEGIATYGVIGEATDHHTPAVRARLLHVRPGVIDQYIDHVLGPVEGTS
jgi:hypothetical protein